MQFFSMAKFTLFLVHGIGIHSDASWADETITMLEKAWQSDVSINAPMSDYIDPVPISYDQVFESYLDDFSDLGKAAWHDAIDLSHEEKQKLSETLTANTVNDRHFVWSYLVDVLLYKMSLVKEQVNALVAKQLYERISQGQTQDNFGIIAHSLGTRVINDTLQNIRTGTAEQSNFYKQGYRLKFLMQISDVTDLFGLPLNKDKFPPMNVYPHDTYDYFRTITNRFDPIARIIPTRLNHWPEGRTCASHMGRLVYKDILCEHVHDTNVHGLTHYMLHPEVTDEIFDLCGFGRVLIEHEERVNRFPALGPKVQPGLKTALQGMMSDAVGLADDSWQTYVNIVLKFGDFSAMQHSPEEIS
jgi:hypothetical protein